MTAGSDIERRAIEPAAFSASSGGRRLEGYAARFGVVAAIGSFVERIGPGAFSTSLSGDVLALMDHDPGKVLGRTRSKTLQLEVDNMGLRFDLTLPDTQAGRDVAALAERGDLGGMSFGFRVKPGGESWEGNTRTLTSIELLEISVVSSWPAYPDTSVALRSMQAHSDAMRRFRALRLAEASQWA
ncbi:HK97 family phage prohead protease [Bosea sp. (in: a-proteobacteria)]|uniref:HK97 family phage prohead protease n=1 Tax=Bosea sp. (in: a-proteobacteria) TaxID=1871050 RepID=UPI002B45B4EF|nr:HK97 family phage prohead protease [Bosea sp. (in: a-proteobacteria)]WRH58615.1 MAG: HK97 family phage prohead protease [Bosea sp. (in: a-proteobacteria)]